MILQENLKKNKKERNEQSILTSKCWFKILFDKQKMFTFVWLLKIKVFYKIKKNFAYTNIKNTCPM